MELYLLLNMVGNEKFLSILSLPTELAIAYQPKKAYYYLFGHSLVKA